MISYSFNTNHWGSTVSNNFLWLVDSDAELFQFGTVYRGTEIFDLLDTTDTINQDQFCFLMIELLQNIDTSLHGLESFVLKNSFNCKVLFVLRRVCSLLSKEKIASLTEEILNRISIYSYATAVEEMFNLSWTGYESFHTPN